MCYLAVPSENTFTSLSDEDFLWEGSDVHTTLCPARGLEHGGFLAFVDSTSIKVIPGYPPQVKCILESI